MRQATAGRRRREALENAAAADSVAPAAADLALDRVEAAELRTALAAVPDDQLQVLRLAYYGGYRHHEIADMLSLPLGTVKSRMRLELDRLRRHLDPGVVA
jgi:RNA polymerase sigma-70 factor (ECF subfamily)